MRRSLYVVLPALALIVIALACGGSGSGGDESEGTPTAEATGTAGAPEATETPGVDLPPGTTPVPGATPAVMPEDVQAFLAQFVDDVPTHVDCEYDDETGLADCTEAGHGKFQLAPWAPDTVVSCTAGILDDEVVWIRCLTDLSIFFYQVAAE